MFFEIYEILFTNVTNINNNLIEKQKTFPK